MALVTVPVTELHPGDTLPGVGGWQAVSDPYLLDDGGLAVDVQYLADGGMSTRVWDVHSVTLEVERPGP